AAPAVTLWREARRTGELPDQRRIEEARSRIGWTRIKLDERTQRVSLESGTALDLGALGKGYAADEALKTLATYGIDRALVDIGGDLALGEAPPGRSGWRVAVAGEESRSLEIVRAGVAHSSDAAQFLESGGVRYSHIIDPRTGLALTKQRAVTVVAPNAMTADALASALSVLDADEAGALLEQFTVRVVHRSDSGG
ncbi:MAG: FAD:protein FMN transferase, partial [Planctomycetota bacterium]